MSAFASVDDYTKRYGAVDDTQRLECLLDDASDYLKALYFEEWGVEYSEGEHAIFDAGSLSVCCAIVSRTLNTPTGLEGVSQATQSADVYSASYTFSNPTGDFYLTKSDKDRLGIGGGCIGTICPQAYIDHETELDDGIS